MARALRWMPCCALLGLLAFPAQASGPWMCLDAEDPRSHAVAGPCQIPEPGKFLPGAGTVSPAVAANFGLLLPAPGGDGAGGWQFVCDDGYATTPPDRLWRAPGGALFAGSRGGLLRSDDGCDWSPVEGDLAGHAIVDLVFEATGRMFALGTDPGAVYLSSDDGRHFTVAGQVAATLPGGRLRGSASDPARLYLTAGLPGMTAGAWVSRDAGRTWTAQPPAIPLPGPLGVLAVAPADADTVYFKVTEPEGDELWRSSDGGRTLARLLKLSDFELLAGLVFGPAGPGGETTLYVAGRAPIVVDGVPPGRLYISRDGGATWLPPVPAGASGPSYRCLESSGGKLYACAGGEAAGEPFLVGVSEDEGRSWTPVVRLADVHGPRACVRDRCLRTELWLCEGYGQCAAPDGGTVDAAADGIADAPIAPTSPSDGGCGCALGAAPGAPAATLLVGVAVLLLVRARRNKSPR